MLAAERVRRGEGVDGAGDVEDLDAVVEHHDHVMRFLVCHGYSLPCPYMRVLRPLRHSRRARSAILESVQIAQPENCSPLAVAFAAGLSACADGDWKPTVAEGASITRPVRDREVLAAVASSGGDFQTVPEDEIPRAVLSLAANGLYTEPTSSIVAAAIPGFHRPRTSPRRRDGGDGAHRLGAEGSIDHGRHRPRSDAD